MNAKSIADILGPWVDPEWDSGLVERCRESWNVPISKLSNAMLATFLRQHFATTWILEEAIARLNSGFDDESEIYEGELAENAREAHERQTRCL